MHLIPDVDRRQFLERMLTGSLAMCVSCTESSPATCAVTMPSFAALRRGSTVPLDDTGIVRTCAWSADFTQAAHSGAATYVRSDEVTPQYARDHPLTTFRAPDGQGRVHGYRLAAQEVFPETFGIRRDGGQSVHPAFLALAGTDLILRIPAGDHPFDNNVLRQINSFRGTVIFDPGSRLVFRDDTKKGLYFFRGSPTLKGGTFTTRHRPGTRQLDAPLLYFNQCDAPSLQGVVIERGSGAGIVARWSNGLRATDIRIADVLADGLDLFNCSDFAVRGVRTERTGDDGVAVLDYRDGPRVTGGILADIDVRDSTTRGITMVGPTNVILDGFRIENTQGSGLLIGEDASNGLRVPTGCVARNGVIVSPGRRTVDPAYSGNRYGIEIAMSGSVELTDIRLENCATRGVDASSTRADAHLVTVGVLVAGAEQEGFHVRGQTAWTFRRIETRDTGSAGIHAANIDRMTGGERSVVRACGSGAPFRAVWDEAIGYQDVRHTLIADDRIPARGYVYYARGSGRGQARQFTWKVSGPFFYDCRVPGLAVRGHGPASDGMVTPGLSRFSLDPAAAFRWYVDGRIDRDRTLVLPGHGQFPGMRMTVSRRRPSGAGSVRIIDPGPGGAVMATLAPGVAGTATLRWDGLASRWRIATSPD